MPLTGRHARMPCAWDRRNSGPARTVPARSRADPGILEDLPDRGRRHRDAEPRELAVDLPVSPRLVLPRQPQHHRPHLAMRRRAPRPAPARHAHRRRTMWRCQRKTVPGATISRITARRSADTVSAGSASHTRSGHFRREWARPLPLDHSELVAQHEVLGVLPPPLPARQPKQRHDTGDDEEARLQPRKPKIIPRPRSPRGAEQPATTGASGQVAQVLGTG